MLRKLTPIAWTLVALAACSDTAKKQDEHAVWESIGYGYVLDATGETPVLYERTASSCVQGSPAYAEPIHLTAADLSARGARAAVRLGIDAVPVSFRRLDALPAECRDGGTPPSDDPRAALALLCETFLENYAFLSLKGVDLAARCEAASAQVGAQTTPEELVTVMLDLLEPLRDGHVVLYTSPSDARETGPTATVLLELYEEWSQQSEVESFGAFVMLQRERHQEIVAERLGAPMGVAADGVVSWGQLDERTGYLTVLGMANPDVALEEQASSIGQGVDEALADLGALPALVLDLRDNTGGHDAVALAVAGRLRTGTHAAFSVEARDGAGFTAPYHVEVRAAGPRQFTGRLAVLTSELTVSAAEVALLALQTRPDTIRVGETTAGFLSDSLLRTLPNGWVVSLSNERYTGPDGVVPEGQGMAPDVAVDCFTRADREAGTDTVLDAALDALWPE